MFRDTLSFSHQSPELDTAGISASDDRREPHALERPIARERILVIAKMSKLEWDMKQTGLTEGELIEQYQQQGDGSEKIFSSYLRQKQVVEDLRQELDPRQIISISDLTPEKFSQYELVISLGGDDHFKQVSHYIDDNLPILGVNSDPATSTGALLYSSAVELPNILRALERGDYRLEPWTRIRLSIDGKDYGPAINEIVLGKQDFRLMSRHLLELDGEKVLHRSSGLLISTGAGSTGWFSNAGLYLGSEPRAFDKSADYARFELREPSVTFLDQPEGRRVVFPPLVEGVLEKGKIMKVTSLNNSEGIATRDSLDSIPFKRGSVAEISVDSKPLWVVAPNPEKQ